MLSDNFNPHVLFRGGAMQTIAALYWPQARSFNAASERRLVSIGESGYLSIVENAAPDWELGKRIVLLVHGLTGSEDSTHLVRLARAFVEQGLRVVRMNMRGCGPGLGLAKGIYHSGRSEDVRAVLEWIGQTYPRSPVTQIGISLGGNATLKMAGEFGSQKPDFLDGIVAVSAPIDLASSSRRLCQMRNILFDRYFCKKLMDHVNQQRIVNLDAAPPIPSALRRGRPSLARFDDLYVAPTSGFRSGQHYYEVCSSLPLIPNIRCRALLLTAKDDPIVPFKNYELLPKNKLHHVIITNRGGHAAWLAGRVDSQFRRFWMDRLIVDWVMAL